MKRFILLILFLNVGNLYSQNYQYLGSFGADGKPDYLEPVDDIVSGEMLSMIDSALPENYPVPDYNPQYISSGYDSDLYIDETADIWVTFVAEGAGYKNVLGFYTYDTSITDNAVPSPEDITIIFPNVSAQYSGGGLVTGNKVHLGRFPAGTGIGWVLLANGFQNNSVTPGLWQLYSNENFNPESDEKLRKHNVLLNDPENERIILGFEDIRRDYASCDQDFNDAIFYITSNPYEAIRTTNLSEPDSGARTVSSGNEGGLESNGDLATLIAKRNLKRLRGNNNKSKRNKQSSFLIKSASSSLILDTYLPETGKMGTEIANYSSPTDLLGITNATEVIAVDYYNNDERVAAVLSTLTEESIYDHSKAICDRLNGSKLEDIRTVSVRNHQLIISKIKRKNGEIEYAVSFSIKLGIESNELFSFWNIDRYPSGDFANYQVWGGSHSQVFNIVNYIIDTYSYEKPLYSTTQTDVIPQLFVMSGYYKNGSLELAISNKYKHDYLFLNGQLKESEISSKSFIEELVPLSSEITETITIDTGSLFDIGIAISPNPDSQIDALYLADGPWGMDFLNDQVVVDVFDIQSGTINDDENKITIERSPLVKGEIKQTLNLFRHLQAGDQTLNISEYSTVSFKVSNSLPMEVILITDQEISWEDRLRVYLPAHSSTENINLALSDFLNSEGESVHMEQLQSIVFSIQGDYNTFQPFEVAISDLYFGNETLSVNYAEEEHLENLVNYPNPFQIRTTILLPERAPVVQLKVIDMLGRIVDRKEITTDGKKEITYRPNNLSPGIYSYMINSNDKNVYTGRMIIQ